MLKNTQATAWTTGPFASEMYEITQTTGAPLRIRSIGAGKVKAVRSGDCRLRPHTIAVSEDDGGGSEEGRQLRLARRCRRAGTRGRATSVRNRRRSECRSSPGRPRQVGNDYEEAQRGRNKRPPSTKAAEGGAMGAPGETGRIPDEEVERRRFPPSGFTKFDQLPSRPKEFAEA